MASGVTFRAAVGIIVTDGLGMVLSCERADKPGQWQLPQGGIDAGEEPRASALRELEEETGIPPQAVSLVAEHPEWLAYELPPHLRKAPHRWGQVLRWFVFRLDAAEAVIDLEGAASSEFKAWQWEPLASLAARTVSFRRPLYRRLAELFAGVLAR